MLSTFLSHQRFIANLQLIILVTCFGFTAHALEGKPVFRRTQKGPGERTPAVTGRARAPRGDYAARATREHPVTVGILVDQSGSMRGKLPGNPARPKANAAAAAVNRYLSEIGFEANKTTHTKDIARFAVLGVHSIDGTAIAAPLLTKPTGKIVETKNKSGIWVVEEAAAEVMTPSEMEEAAVARIELSQDPRVNRPRTDFVSETVPPVIHLIRSVAEGGTPLAHGLKEMKRILEKHQDPKGPASHVLMASDYEPNEGGSDPHAATAEAARALRETKTSDGETLLWAAHLDPNASGISTPVDRSQLTTASGKSFFDIASIVPESVRKLMDANVAEGARLMFVNGNVASLSEFLRLGTSTATGTRLR